MAGHIKVRTTKSGQKRYLATLPGIPSRTFVKRTDAQRWLDDRRAAILRGELLIPATAGSRGVTFGQLVDQWVETWEGRLEPTSQVRYRRKLDLYILPEFGDLPAASITHHQIQRYVDQLLAGHKRRIPVLGHPGRQRTKAPSAATVRAVHATIGVIFTEAIRAGHLRHNPARHIRLPRKARRAAVILSREEINCLADQLPPAYALAVRLAAATGIRAGELWALRRRDVDFLHNKLHIERALKNVNGKLLFGPTKTHQARSVIFPASLAPAVQAHLDTRPPLADTLLFVGPHGQPVRHTGGFISMYWRKATRAALPPDKWRIVWHDLRHTHASILLGEGAPVIAVSKRLGHASVTKTLDIYGHLLDHADAELAEMFGNDPSDSEDEPPAAAAIPA